MEKLKSGKNYLEKLYEKLRNDPKIILLHVAVFLVSFIVSHAKIGPGISPFGIALCSVAPGEYIFSCFIGQAFGYASSQSFMITSRYILSSFLIKMILYNLSKRQTEFRKIWFLAPLCVFSVAFVGGMISNAFIRMDRQVFFAVLSESIAAGASSYFFAKCFDVLESPDDLSVFSPRHFVCLAFSSGVFLLSMSSFNFYEVSVSRIIVGWLVLLFAYAGGEIASCVAGVVGGISVGIYTSSSYDIISLSLSGVLAGVFSPLGSVGCVCAFLLCRFAVFFFSSPDAGLFALCAESAVSVTLFLALPKSFALNLKNIVLPSEEKADAYITKKEASKAMLRASETIGEISDSIDNVSVHLRRLNESNLKAIYCRVQSDVCNKCKRCSYCSDKNFRSTFLFFEQISKTFEENERVTKDDLPKKFVSLCSEVDEFLKSFEKYYRRHKELMREEAEAERLRKEFLDRLNCDRDILLKFSGDFSSEKIADRKTASAIKAIMVDHGIKPLNVLCVVDEKGVMLIKAVCKSLDGNVNKDRLVKDIEDLTLRRFELPTISYRERGITLEMEQKPWISVKTGLVRIPSKGATLCGDCCESFTKNGVLSVILSDGMGTGGRAAVDSAMSSEFFKKLVLGGFGEDVALKLVNSSMLVKSSYESLATIDYAKIDLFTGRTQFFKAGAAATVLKKGGKAMTVEGASLPVGILREIEFSRENVSLCPSDIIVMMSDGATASGTKWIEEEVESFSRSNAEDLARSIALKAVENSSGTKQDDVTVFAAILE